MSRPLLLDFSGCAPRAGRYRTKIGTFLPAREDASTAAVMRRGVSIETWGDPDIRISDSQRVWAEQQAVLDLLTGIHGDDLRERARQIMRKGAHPCSDPTIIAAIGSLPETP